MHKKTGKKLPKNVCTKSSLNIQNETNVEALEEKYPHVWRMTSRNFHTDSNARLDSAISHLKDAVTMKCFKDAIRYNRHLFKGRIVLVLNCGQEWLFALWAAQNGAAHVYAVDSSFAVEYLQSIIEANKLIDRITILQGCIEEITLPVEKVDVIICNWMGYSLVFNSRCESVIYARDKWLKKDTGVIFPDKAQLYVAGIANSKHKNERVNWWHDVHGFNMKALRSVVLEAPIFQRISPTEILTAPVKIWKLDLNEATAESVTFRTPFMIDIQCGGRLEGILTFFDVQFSKAHTPIGLTTSPWSPQTNWLQSVFYFDESLTVNLNDKFYCGIAFSTKVNSHSKITNVVMELFTGIPEDLSLLLKMKWSSTELIESVAKVDVEKREKKTTKSTTKEEQKELIKESQITKQSKNKCVEKKRKFSKKIAASIFF